MESARRCLTALAVVFVVLGHGAAEEPSFEVHIDRLERLNDNSNYFKYNYTYEKVSEMKFRVGAHVQQLEQLDDSYTVKVTVGRAELADGSEYEVMVDLRKPVCDWMRTIYKTYFYEELEKVSNFPHYDTCPLPATDYYIKDYEFDTEPYKGMMSEGRWKIEMMLLKGDEVCSGILIVNTVTLKA